MRGFGVLKPDVHSFESALLSWLDGIMREEARRGWEGFQELLDFGIKSTDLNRELLIAYMYVLTRISRKHYSSASEYKRGMDRFHSETYKWIVTNADINFEVAKPFEDFLRLRYAAYDIAFNQKDLGMHYFAKTFITTLDDSLQYETIGKTFATLPLLKCTAAFSFFSK